jgi:hypothetical protein
MRLQRTLLNLMIILWTQQIREDFFPYFSILNILLNENRVQLVRLSFVRHRDTETQTHTHTHTHKLRCHIRFTDFRSQISSRPFWRLDAFCLCHKHPPAFSPEFDTAYYIVKVRSEHGPTSTFPCNRQLPFNHTVCTEKENMYHSPKQRENEVSRNYTYFILYFLVEKISWQYIHSDEKHSILRTNSWIHNSLKQSLHNKLINELLNVFVRTADVQQSRMKQMYNEFCVFETIWHKWCTVARK